jgi:hypothetical protein
MKRKMYVKPSTEVVVLNYEARLLAGSEVQAGMPGTFTEEPLAPPVLDVEALPFE